MKIWLVDHYANTMTEAGGVRQLSMAREMVNRGNQVTIVASNFNHLIFEEANVSLSSLEDVNGVKIWRIPVTAYSGNGLSRVWNMLSFALNFWKASQGSDVEKPDVILGSSPHLFAAFASQRIAQRFSIPFVMEIRDLWPQSLVDLDILWKYHPFVTLLSIVERYLYKKASGIVTLLPNSIDYLINLGVKKDNVICIPNGVNLDLIQRQPQPPISKEKFTIVFAGAHGYANSLDTALDAMKIISHQHLDLQIELHLVGDGTQKERLQARAKQEQIGNVKFFDPVPKTEIYDILETADIFLMPLLDSPVFYWGVSPNKLFDYFAMARPVIFAVNSPFDLVAKAGAGISIPPNNPQELAAAIKKLSLLSAAERWEMGINGRKYLEANHDLQKLSHELESFLFKVVREKNSF
jgi:glycosyltransferase involved in cell wall biosynthesis